MTQDDAANRDIGALYRRELMSEGSASCPSDGELASLFLDDSSDSEDRSELVEHVVSCRKCAAAVRLVAAIDSEARDAGPESSEGVTRARGPFVLAAAAALVVGIGGLAWLGTERDAPDDALRGASESVAPEDGARLQAVPAELSWPAEPGASGYRLRLHRTDGAPVWESEALSAPRAVLTEEAIAALESGGSFYWTVTVEGPVRRDRLGPFSFAIVR